MSSSNDGCCAATFFLLMVISGGAVFGAFGAMNLAGYVEFENTVIPSVLDVINHSTDCLRIDGGSCVMYTHEFTLYYDAPSDEYARSGGYTQRFNIESVDECPSDICRPNATYPGYIYPCIMLPYDETVTCGIGMRYYQRAIYIAVPSPNIALYVFSFWFLLISFALTVFFAYAFTH